LRKSQTRQGLSEQTHVTWTGHISGDLKYGALLSAEVLALPSHQENFGVVIAESLACGRPVLISNKVNIWRSIAEAEAGFVETDDLPGTERLLASWFNLAPEKQLKMGTNAKECFRQKFEIHSVYKRLMAVITRKKQEYIALG